MTEEYSDCWILDEMRSLPHLMEPKPIEVRVGIMLMEVVFLCRQAMSLAFISILQFSSSNIANSRPVIS